METSQDIGELAASLAKAQGAIKAAAKDSQNPHFKSKYADLAGVMDACRAELSANNLAITQWPGECADGRMAMTTMLIHSSGQWMRETLTIPLSKIDAQGYGSATTYARRYALAAAIGIVQDDDDGNAASAPKGVANDAPAKAPAWREAGSPYSTPTALHKALTSLERELAGCGDSDMVYALCGTDEWREFARVAGLHAPHYLNGGDPAPEEFEGLLKTAERMVKQFDAAIANGKADLAHT